MKYPSFFHASLVMLVATCLQAHAAPENRVESLGPLMRLDPNEKTPEFIVKIHGDPRKGLPESAGYRVQRLSDKSWYLEMGKRIARMEPHYPSGQVIVREIIAAGGEWVVSPDEKLIFATRMRERTHEVSECFNMENGESKWTFEKGMSIMDACFTPDGTQVVILHSLPSPPVAPHPPISKMPTPEEMEKIRRAFSPKQAAVTWYDAATGEMKRRIELPGEGFERGAERDFLSFSRNFLYVARPGDGAEAICMYIKDGETEPVKVDVGAVGKAEEVSVRVGGKYGEFVVFHSSYHAVLFRRDKDGALTQLNETRLETTPEGDPHTWCPRFTPDGNHLALSSCLHTIFLSTRGQDDGEKKVQPGGSHLSDFSNDGKFFVTFDDGGGRVRNSSTWKMQESFEAKIRPSHCCPIKEAGFSISGDYIISSDDARLLLWHKDGRQLAELYSERSETSQRVEMQSPVVVESQGKIYGADGYDFLMWDLTALHKRLGRKPDNIPRVKGEVVFRDRERDNKSPEVMNIHMDAKGEHLVTATRNVVRYRPTAAAKPVVVPVPKDDIFMRPRMFMDGISPGTIIVRPGMDAYSLDLTGKNESVLLSHHFLGTYTIDGGKFALSETSTHPSVLSSRPADSLLDSNIRSTPVTTLPVDWYLRPEFSILSPDGKWLAAIPSVWGKGSLIAVVDMEKKEITRSIPVDWTATTVAFSSDGDRLLVGSTNRAIYEFDFRKMTAQP